MAFEGLNSFLEKQQQIKPFLKHLFPSMGFSKRFLNHLPVEDTNFPYGNSQHFPILILQYSMFKGKRKGHYLFSIKTLFPHVWTSKTNFPSRSD